MLFIMRLCNFQDQDFPCYLQLVETSCHLSQRMFSLFLLAHPPLSAIYTLAS